MMMQKIEDIKKWVAVKLYDSLEGKFIRDIKSNNITHPAIASTSCASTTDDEGFYGPVCSGTTDAYHEAYVTAYGFSSSTAGAEMFFLVGTTGNLISTVVPTHVEAYKPFCQYEDIDAPFYKIPPSSSIALFSHVAGTFCGWCTLIHHPIFKYVEPTSTQVI